MTQTKTAMLRIEKEDNWETPEGVLQATYRETRIIEKAVGGRIETVVRPVFQVTSLTSPKYQYVVSKNYRLSESQKFKADFKNWLGDGFYDLMDEEGVISKDALDSLIGHKADLHVVHIPNEGHRAPFSHLVTIGPPGTLSKLN